MRIKNHYFGGTVISSGGMTINGIKIDLSDPIGTCKRILELVPDEDQLEFANEIIENINATPTTERKKRSVVTEERECSGFISIKNSTSCNIFFKQSDKFRVAVEGKQDHVDKIITEVESNRLVIEQENCSFIQNVKIYVEAPQITGVTMAGSGNFTAQTAIDAEDEDFSIALRGSGDMKFTKINCEDLDVDINASGNVDIDEVKAFSSTVGIHGSGDVTFNDMDIHKNVALSVQGSGDISIYGKAKKIKANVQGSGDIRGTVTCDNVTASVMGSGDIRLTGNIKEHTESVMGTGDVHIG